MEEYRRVKRSNGKVTWEERTPVKKDRGETQRLVWFIVGMAAGFVCGILPCLFLGGL